MPRIGSYPSALGTRREVLGGIAAAGGLAATSSPAAQEIDWPEFWQWYSLLLEEQRIYDEEDEADQDRLLDAMDEKRGPLERVLLAREPKTAQHLAMLAVIELRYAEKYRDPVTDGRKFLVLGAMETENGYSCNGAVLIESTIRMALRTGLLPGVTIYGEGT